MTDRPERRHRKATRDPDELPQVRSLTHEESCIRMTYAHYRRVLEWLKSPLGSERTAIYRLPSSYNGRPGKFLSGQNVRSEKPFVAGRGSEWEKLNLHCQKHGIDPILYIAIIFDHLPRGAHTPEPGNMRADSYVIDYQDALAGLPAKIRVSLGVERETAKARIAVQSHYWPKAAARVVTEWDIYESVLSDLTLLSSLFRYCLAVDVAKRGGSRFRQLANRIRPDAVLQYYPYRQFYLDSWQAVLPEDFVTNAEQWFYDILHSEMKGV